MYLFLLIVCSIISDRGICYTTIGSESLCQISELFWWFVCLIFCLSFFVFALFLRLAIRRKYGIREECCT